MLLVCKQNSCIHVHTCVKQTFDKVNKIHYLAMGARTNLMKAKKSSGPQYKRNLATRKAVSKPPMELKIEASDDSDGDSDDEIFDIGGGPTSTVPHPPLMLVSNNKQTKTVRNAARLNLDSVDSDEYVDSNDDSDDSDNVSSASTVPETFVPTNQIRTTSNFMSLTPEQIQNLRSMLIKEEHSGSGEHVAKYMPNLVADTLHTPLSNGVIFYGKRDSVVVLTGSAVTYDVGDNTRLNVSSIQWLNSEYFKQNWEKWHAYAKNTVRPSWRTYNERMVRPPTIIGRGNHGVTFDIGNRLVEKVVPIYSVYSCLQFLKEVSIFQILSQKDITPRYHTYNIVFSEEARHYFGVLRMQKYDYSLSAWLKQHRELTAEVAQQLLQTLEKISVHGRVYCTDLKFDNFVVNSGGGSVKMIDTGVFCTRLKSGANTYDTKDVAAFDKLKNHHDSQTAILLVYTLVCTVNLKNLKMWKACVDLLLGLFAPKLTTRVWRDVSDVLRSLPASLKHYNDWMKRTYKGHDSLRYVMSLLKQLSTGNRPKQNNDNTGKLKHQQQHRPKQVIAAVDPATRLLDVQQVKKWHKLVFTTKVIYCGNLIRNTKNNTYSNPGNNPKYFSSGTKCPTRITSLHVQDVPKTKVFSIRGRFLRSSAQRSTASECHCYNLGFIFDQKIQRHHGRRRHQRTSVGKNQRCCKLSCACYRYAITDYANRSKYCQPNGYVAIENPV